MPPRFRVNGAGEFQPPPDWNLGSDRTRAWQDLDLWFLRTGYGRVDTPDGTFDLLPGACLIMRGGESYDFHVNFEHPVLHYWVHFDCLDSAGAIITPADADVPRRFRQLEEPAFVEQLVGRAVSAVRRGRTPDAELWLHAALTEIARLDERSERQKTLTDQQARVESICRAIDKRPQERWDISEMCKVFCGCRSHLYRAFVNHTGRSPQQYVIDARMRQARTLLTESDNDIGWIAEQLGYRDVYFFSRQFKRFHDCSPSQYRR